MSEFYKGILTGVFIAVPALILIKFIIEELRNQ